jgi:phosphate-selective porin OprO/OprP
VLIEVLTSVVVSAAGLRACAARDLPAGVQTCAATDRAAGPKTGDFSPATPGSAQDPAQPATDKKPKGGKKPKSEKTPKSEKKPKKKNGPSTDKPAPDDPIDQEAVDGGTGVRFVWKQHPSLRFGSVLRVDFQAKFQEDAHSSYPDAKTAAGLETFELHRNRIGIEGNLFKHIEYEVERELTEQELTDDDVTAGVTPKSPWKDVDVNLTYVKNAQIQIGKFKVPFGLDQLTGVSHNDFVYRSQGANYLAPARDIGAMVHGRFFKHGLNYWAGVFRHDGDNARSKKIQGGDETFAARLTGAPFRKLGAAFAALEVGTAFAVSALSDDSFRPNGLRGRTVMTQDTFYTPVYVKGRRHRWEGDVDWTAGPVSARAEYTWLTDDRLQQGILENDLPDARARAWYVAGTWLVTGEDKKRPVKAANDFLRGGIGAVEVAGRYERLWFDSAGGTDTPTRANRSETILTSGEKVLTLGVNWTLNRFIKVQINGIRERVEDPGRSPVPNGAAFWSRVLRLQFVL